MTLWPPFEREPPKRGLAAELGWLEDQDAGQGQRQEKIALSMTLTLAQRWRIKAVGFANAKPRSRQQGALRLLQ